MFEPIEFFSCIVAREEPSGRLLVALFDGHPPQAVALLRCDRDAALSLRDALGSALGSRCG